LANEIVEMSADDQLFEYDREEYKSIDREKPWKKDAKFFTEVKLSALALIKISTHAKRGGELEVMGLLQGKVTRDGKFIVADAFPLPVEGTETRVSAQSEANEYMIEYNDCAKRNGREEHVVGWYHSHPGYGCWLSGIDVDTQSQNQMFSDCGRSGEESSEWESGDRRV
jgi:COP9 signalosome complex subunit 5